jgi:hypothetical protein
MLLLQPLLQFITYTFQYLPVFEVDPNRLLHPLPRLPSPLLAPPQGQVLSCQVGADLGLAATLYPATAAANPNPEAAATIDFPSAKEAAAFWKTVGADPKFLALAKGITANPRLQYAVATGAPTAAATVR